MEQEMFIEQTNDNKYKLKKGIKQSKTDITKQQLMDKLDKITKQVQQEKTQLSNIELKRQRMIELNKKKKESKLQQENIICTQKSSTTDDRETMDDEEVGPVKKIKSNAMKERWSSSNKIININYPQKISQDSSIKRRKYYIQFKYRDENNKVRDATVRFGSTNGQDYIDNKDPVTKKKFHLRYGGLSNPFDPNYWRYHLCNKEESLQQAFCSYILTLNL